MTEARRIYQEQLDRVSKAVWDRDFNTVADEMLYPHMLKTLDEVREVPNRDVLIQGVRRFRQTLDGLAATAYHRICDDAAFEPGRDDMIRGHHRVFILRGGSYVRDPYTSQSTLVLKDGRWLCAGLDFGAEDADLPILPPQPNPTDTPTRRTQ